MTDFDTIIRKSLQFGKTEYLSSEQQLDAQLQFLRNKKDILIYEFMEEQKLYRVHYATNQEIWNSFIKWAETNQLNPKLYKTAQQFQQSVLGYNSDTNTFRVSD